MPKILYVEDNEDNVYMLTRRLQRAGFEVVVAADGEQGVALAREERPDLVLMDLSLPVLDGWEATRRLKSADETRAIPIIALSAHAMPTGAALVLTRCWIRIYGVVCMEVFQHLGFVVTDMEPFFESELQDLMTGLGVRYIPIEHMGRPVTDAPG